MEAIAHGKEDVLAETFSFEDGNKTIFCLEVSRV